MDAFRHIVWVDGHVIGFASRHLNLINDGIGGGIDHRHGGGMVGDKQLAAIRVELMSNVRPPKPTEVR